MKTSQKGIDLICKFEGLRLKAYKAIQSEKYYTIGYGHYGSDVKPYQTITIQEALKLLEKDLKKFEKNVNKYNSLYKFNQNEFDSLVSFAYNIGSIDQLTHNGTRTKKQIATAILNYNKANGKVLAGLVKRRKAEQELFLAKVEIDYYPTYYGNTNSITEALFIVGELDTSFANRRKIAIANGMKKYVGTANQNLTLLSLLKDGKLIKA